MNKNKIYTFFLVLSVSSMLLAVITIIPSPGASKPSLLGYYAVCSFAPISTLIFVVISAIFYVVGKRLYAAKLK
ncbi:MAG: hypothetical protein JW841_10085 [Deltaproteobacteria bacterium]|nr:hypothetical protein [Deltaproteobacteria bacterium]